jgi:Cu-Zn family superoxide dismutase
MTRTTIRLFTLAAALSAFVLTGCEDLGKQDELGSRDDPSREDRDRYEGDRPASGDPAVRKTGGTTGSAPTSPTPAPGTAPSTPSATPAASGPQVDKAVAVLVDAQGGKMGGVVRFQDKADGLHLMADIEGLTPGLHTISIADEGDCTSENAGRLVPSASAPAPAGTSPSAPSTPSGSMPGSSSATGIMAANQVHVDVTASGRGAIDKAMPELSLEGPQSIIGRAVVIQTSVSSAPSKDQKTAAAPKAGLYCGVIGIDK